MLIKKINKKHLQVLLLSCALGLGACSSDEEQTEEPVENEEGSENQNNSGNENNEGNNDASAQGENQAETTEDASASSETQGDANANTLATSPTENGENTAPPSESSVPPPIATAPESPPAAPVAAPAAPSAAPADTGGIGPQPNRFVRYVKVASATVHAEPNEGSASVVTLSKGDHILVSEENGWGKIADGRYIKLSDLSNKGVPRDRTPVSWN